MSSDNLSAEVERYGKRKTLVTVNQEMTHNEIYEEVNKHMGEVNYILKYGGKVLPRDDNKIEIIEDQDTKIIARKVAPRPPQEVHKGTKDEGVYSPAAAAAAAVSGGSIQNGGRRRRRRKTKRRKTSRRTKRHRTKRRRTKRRKSR